MTMNQTGTPVTIDQYPNYVHNCTRNAACEPPYAAPLPSVPLLQLYVLFGIYKPALVQFYLQDTCADADPEQLFPSNYVVGQTPEGQWYGVFKYFNAPLSTVTNFVVWLSALVDAPGGLVERTFFTELLQVEPCDPLTKVKACQPENATTTGFDANGLYYGLPVNDDFLGIAEVRYFHIAWVRLGKQRELNNKATFVSSIYTTFRSTLERTYQLETELVPRWYKDELLAIYMRGALQINDGPTLVVSDLAIEPLNDNDLTWKPFVQLKTTTLLYFGCDASECVECCSPLVISASSHVPDESASGSESAGPCDPIDLGSNTAAPDGAVGVPYSYHLNLVGTPPYIITLVNAKPSWMTITPDGTGLQYGGTPDAPGTTIDVSVNVANDCGSLLGLEFFIDVTA